MLSFDLTIKVEHLLTGLTIIIAGLVFFVAYRQYKLANEKFKIDLFEKRYVIYKHVRLFFDNILRKANVSIDMKSQLYRDTQEAIFLFDDDVNNYLEDIQKKATDLYLIMQEPVGQQDTNKIILLISWFEAQITGLNPRLIEIFSPYLKFKVWK